VAVPLVPLSCDALATRSSLAHLSDLHMSLINNRLDFNRLVTNKYRLVIYRHD
jgi:hypothetical protein